MTSINNHKSINSIYKNKLKYQTINQNAQCLQEIQKLGLMYKLLNPTLKHNLLDKRQQNSHQTLNNFYTNSQLYQGLNMDLTSYQTLKQLIVQNKNLVKQSQSAYFLSRQSQKLINFIDGWDKLQKDQFDQQSFKLDSLSFKNNKKQQQMFKNQSQYLYQQQQAQRQRQRIKQKNKIIIQGQEQLKKIQQNIIKKRQIKKLSTKPPLIVNNQQKDQYLIQQQDSQSIQDIQIQIQNQPTDQNNINCSNIVLNQKQTRQISKKIKNNKPEQNKYSIKSIQKHNRFNLNNEEDQQNISEIIRPQYQKTLASFSSNSQLADSRQSSNGIQPICYVAPIKKKTIPLLKKGKQTVKYNQFIESSKVTLNQVQTNQNNANTIQSVNIQKGFISQDTDANSRISMITNKQLFNKQKQPQIIQERRSLSPKVQNKKKILIKRGSKDNQTKKQTSMSQNNKNQNRHIKLTKNIDVAATQIQNQRQHQVSQKQAKRNNNQFTQNKSTSLQKDLKQLQDEFMNRNIRKSLENKTEYDLANQQNENNQNFYIQNNEQEMFMRSIPKQNKTLKLIKKSSNQQLSHQTINNKGITYEHYPLTNTKFKNMVGDKQQHSIVLQQEPWQCDQLQLEQELKAIDQKIQGRKSMLAAKQNTKSQHGQFRNHNEDKFENHPSHEKINQTQHFQSQEKDQLAFKHKRSHTSVNITKQNKQFYEQKVYNEHLFQQNSNLFTQNNHQNQHHHQPKVVRLSLTALAQNMNKKSRNSTKNLNDRKSLNKISSKNNLQNTNNLKDQNLALVKLNKNPSSNLLKKQPSCKSILLYEEAQKRGISPAKSNHSTKINNKGISPIKLYNQNNPSEQLKRNQNKTPRNYQKSNQVQVLNKNNNLPQVRNKIKNGRFQLQNFSHTPQNVYRNKTPKEERQIRNFSPINRNQKQHDRITNYENQSNPNKSFTSNSRTLSDMVQSQYERAKRQKATNNFNINMRRGFNEKAILNQTYNNTDNSMISNCQKYFDKYEIQNENQNNLNYQQNMTVQRNNLMNKKWNTTQSNQFVAAKRNKIVLLSDQLGD